MAELREQAQPKPLKHADDISIAEWIRPDG
jgi:hypothetical protein